MTTESSGAEIQVLISMETQIIYCDMVHVLMIWWAYEYYETFILGWDVGYMYDFIKKYKIEMKVIIK